MNPYSPKIYYPKIFYFTTSIYLFLYIFFLFVANQHFHWFWKKNIILIDWNFNKVWGVEGKGGVEVELQDEGKNNFLTKIDGFFSVFIKKISNFLLEFANFVNILPILKNDWF